MMLLVFSITGFLCKRYLKIPACLRVMLLERWMLNFNLGVIWSSEILQDVAIYSYPDECDYLVQKNVTSRI